MDNFLTLTQANGRRPRINFTQKVEFYIPVDYRTAEPSTVKTRIVLNQYYGNDIYVTETVEDIDRMLCIHTD